MNKRFVLDLIERTAATYVEGVAGLLLANSTGLLDLGADKAAAAAALPAALAVIKAALAGSVLSGGTASALPARAEPVTAPETAVEQAPATPASA
ncbi:holin [Actinacidiphila sp. bgisy145]|uniref:holin n=1 Tax=Actinacidiphila sp. bgisy145 TaxID=3413792 RepID=UPI003EBC424F